MGHIDGIRGLAAIWVASFHAWIIFFPDRPMPDFIVAAHVAVPMFMVMSGFCLAYPLLSRGLFHIELRSWAIRRALRILPPYYIVMTGLFALQRLPFVAHSSQASSTPDLLAHVFLVHNLWPGHILRISGPLWSIAMECQLYLVFPLLLLWMRRPWVPMLGALAVAGLWWAGAPQGGAQPGVDAAFFYWKSPLALLPLFVMGMVTAWMMAGPRRIPSCTAVVGGALLALSILVDGLATWEMTSTLIAGLGTGLMILLPSGRLGRFLGWGPFVRVGEVAFTFYLTHDPILTQIGQVTAGQFHGPAQAGLAVASVTAALGIAFLLAGLIERPFHHLARRLSGPASA
jgi:peptidoglycan/LPS O-acetylase OafA/YrhL